MRWKWALALGASAILSAVSAPSPGRAEPEPLTDFQISLVIAGRVIQWGSSGIAFYSPNGNYEYVLNDRISFGRYWAEDGRLCVDYTDGRRHCDRIMMDGNVVLMMDDAGRLTPANVLGHSGMLPDRDMPSIPFTRRFCDQDVTFTLVRPGADLGADARAFWGVWRGNWNNLLCTALIVESITSNNEATIVYVNGVGTEAPATQYRVPAKISGKTLSWSSPTIGFEYTLRPSHTLTGSRTSNSAVDHAWMLRQ